MNCREFDLTPCYGCNHNSGFISCELIRHSVIKKFSTDDLKREIMSTIKNKSHVPKDVMQRYEKALEIYRPEIYEWYNKIKVLI